MKAVIVGTKNSITAYANDVELGPTQYVGITKRSDLHGMAPDSYGPVVITYGFRQLPSGQALGIADTLISSGFTRNSWRYV
jgi:hypothetical protein